MKSSTLLEQAVAAHGRELAVVRALLEQAATDAVALYKPWRRSPKGSALSAMTRDRFLELAPDSAELAGSGVAVKSCGEDWVRIWLPRLSWLIPLRTRPKVVRLEDDSLFPDDLFGPPHGTPVLLWRWNIEKSEMTHFSLTRVVTMDNWVVECPIFESIDISADLIAMKPTGSSTPVGAANDDDDLGGLVGRWDSEEPQSEAEHTDELGKEERDDPGFAVGDDNSRT